MNGMDKEELKQNYTSIHTLRMEGDANTVKQSAATIGISIHTLRVEGDVGGIVCPSTVSSFQSTPSAWRVTNDTSFPV